MKLMKKLSIVTAISLMFSSNIAFAQNYYPTNNNKPPHIRLIESNIKSERIPVGTKLKLRIERPVNSLNSHKGQPFIASIVNDVYVRNNVVLPSGTTIRGRISKIKSNTYLSRGGWLELNFELAETPIGRQILIYSAPTESKYKIVDGVFSAGGGYLKALQENIEYGTDILTRISAYSIKKGLSFGRGIPVVVTAPLGVAGGVFVGSSIFFGKSVSALYQKGENVRFNPGDMIEVKLLQPIDIAIN